jgi:hypothetical protein
VGTWGFIKNRSSLVLLLAYGIGFGVYWGGIIGKNRSLGVGMVIGFLCGVAALVVLLSVSGELRIYKTTLPRFSLASNTLALGHGLTLKWHCIQTNREAQ